MKYVEPELFYFEDDGVTPNNILPVLVYRNVFQDFVGNLASRFEIKFQENNWTGNWRDIVMSKNHYHSSTHEVLGISSGSLKLQLGGERGKIVEVSAGDVLILPGGVAHCSLNNDIDYEVVGGYPDGLSWDVIYCEPDKYKEAKKTIELLKVPTTDPLFDKDGPLVNLWK